MGSSMCHLSQTQTQILRLMHHKTLVCDPVYVPACVWCGLVNSCVRSVCLGATAVLVTTLVGLLNDMCAAQGSALKTYCIDALKSTTRFLVLSSVVSGLCDPLCRA